MVGRLATKGVFHMITFYKQYMIQYDERPRRDGSPKQIVVTSIVANGNFNCMYGERIYDSLDDVKRDIDAGRYGCSTH